MTKTMKRMAMLLMMLCMLFAVMSVAQAADEVACDHQDKGVDIVVVEAGDCTKDEPKVWVEYCKACKEFIAAKSEEAHDWKDAVKPADCYNPEYIAKQCAVCKGWDMTNAKQVEGSAKLDHVLAAVAGTKYTAPTCTEMGKWEHAYCTVCNPKAEAGTATKYEAKNLEVAALKHDFTVEVELEADCANPARTAKKCSRCDEMTEFKAVEGSKPLTESKQHSFDTEAGRAESKQLIVKATCQKEGYWQWVCNKCGAKGVKHTIAKDENAHNLVTVEGSVLKVADCVTKTDGIEKQKCTNEGCKFVSEWKYIPFSTAHEWALNGEPTNAGKPCIDGEVKTICTLCKAEGKKEVKATADHDTTFEDQAANCTYAESVVEICKVCDTVIDRITVEDGEKANKNKHIWVLDEEASEEIFKDNCDNCTGDYGVYKCSVCGSVKTANNPNAPKKYEEVTLPADCENNERVQNQCPVCKKLIGKAVDKEDGEKKLGGTHDMTDWEIIKEATCQTAGTHMKWCQNEGCPYSVTEEYKDAKAHVYEIEVLREATCEKTGVGLYSCTEEGCDLEPFYGITEEDHDLVEAGEATNAGKPCVAGTIEMKCTKCDHKETKEVKATADHDYEYGYQAATCKSDAKYGDFCTMCGKGKNVKTIADTKLEHKAEFVEWVKEPTCTTAGVFKAICEYCEKKLSNQETKIEGHKAAEEFTAVSGKYECEETYVVKLCTVCGEEVPETKKVIKEGTDHKGVPGTVAPTCSSEGYDCWYCSECGWVDPASITNVKPADKKTHTAKVVGDPLRAPTCDEVGIGKAVCAECDKDLGYTTIPAKGHDYKDVTPVYNATENKMVKYCKNGCGTYDKDNMTAAKPEDIVPAECAHEMADVAAKAATCTEAGYKAYKACTKCDHTEGFEVIEATGHEKTTTYAFNADFTAKVATTVCANCDLKEIVETPLK